MIKSGTSPGALVREAQYAESQKDFLHKQCIALKETNETIFWLDLIRDAKEIFKEEALEIKEIAIEVLAMLIASTKTVKCKLKI